MHPQEHDEHCHEVTLKNLLLGVFGNAVLAMVEFAVFLRTNSVTIMAASLHDAADAGTSLISYLAEKLAHRFQLPKLSLIAALINSCIVIGSCVIMICGSALHLVVRASVETSGMWLLAIFSFLVNLCMAVKLGHGHSANEQSQANHFLEDALGSVAMLAVWLLSGSFDPTMTDPIVSMIVALYILYRAIPLARETMKQLRS